MDSSIIWLLMLLVAEAAVFVLTLYLARAFTRSHDREWLADGKPLVESSPEVWETRSHVFAAEHQRAES